MADTSEHPLMSSIEQFGRTTVKGVEETGYSFALFIESLLWILFGPFIKQPVRFPLKGYQAIGKMDDESMQSAVKAFDSALSEIFFEYYTDMSSALN